jgi:hypothetical protein
MLLLADFARDLPLDVAHDALAAFDISADDAKAVERGRGRLSFLGSWCGSGGIFRDGGLVGDGVDVDVERRNIDVRLDGGVGAVEFDGLLKAGHGIDGAAENVGFGIAVEVAGGLLNF